MKHHAIKIGVGKYDYRGYLLTREFGLCKIECPEGRLHYEHTMEDAKLHVDISLEAHLDDLVALPDNSMVHHIWR